MRPIVWTRSSCVIGEKAAVAVARENDYYYIVCSVRAEAKKTLSHTTAASMHGGSPVNCFRIRIFYNRTKTRN